MAIEQSGVKSNNIRYFKKTNMCVLKVNQLPHSALIYTNLFTAIHKTAHGVGIRHQIDRSLVIDRALVAIRVIDNDRVSKGQFRGVQGL